MIFTGKHLTASIVLLSFLMAIFFSFAVMSYGQDGRMEGGCPFSAAGASLCPPTALDTVMHHISSYQSFSNVPVNPVVLLASLLLFVAYIFVFAIRMPLLEPISQKGNTWRAPPLSARTRKIARWLALLEHSPSLS